MELKITKPDEKLDIQKPQIENGSIDLKSLLSQEPGKNRLSIGRLDENDIVLPDPSSNVSRHHCCLEFKNSRYFVKDPGSSNGTFIERQNYGGEIDIRFLEDFCLQDKDVILILSHFQEDDPVFWRLEFCDPEITNKVQNCSFYSEKLKYSLNQEKLFRVINNNPKEVLLTPQERKLIKYMASKNYESNNQPTVCTYDELIEAIWPQTFGRTSNEINLIAWRIRRKVEQDPGEPKFLQTVRGEGLRLEIEIDPL